MLKIEFEETQYKIKKSNSAVEQEWIQKFSEQGNHHRRIPWLCSDVPKKKLTITHQLNNSTFENKFEVYFGAKIFNKPLTFRTIEFTRYVIRARFEPPLIELKARYPVFIGL